jgi:hypothetical protein
MPTTYAIPNGSTAFAATTYTGTGAALTVSNAVNGTSFQPDLVWLKSRSTVENHFLFDSVRGSAPNYNRLSSNLTDAEATPGIAMLTAINSNGITLGTNGGVNTNGATFVGWQWKANGAAVTNTAGSITSQVSANTAAGFSVVTYTGTGANATVGHGLGAVPQMIIVKNRNAAISNPAWPVYHISIGNTKYLDIQTTAAQATAITVWNNTTPTSNVFSIGVADSVSGNTNGLVAYCFAAVPGYSAFGSYTGNGSTDGPFIYTGFRPRFIMLKATNVVANWFIRDTSRNPYNGADLSLFPNLSNAESLGAVYDILSNGFKVRSSASGVNGSGDNIIYAAFAENPFKYANAR